MIDSSIIKAAKEHIALSSVIKLSSDVEAVERQGLQNRFLAERLNSAETA